MGGSLKKIWGEGKSVGLRRQVSSIKVTLNRLWRGQCACVRVCAGERECALVLRVKADVQLRRLVSLKAITLGAAVGQTAPQICRPCIAHSRKRAPKPAAPRHTPISGLYKQTLIESRDRLMRSIPKDGKLQAGEQLPGHPVGERLNSSSRQTSEEVKTADSAGRTPQRRGLFILGEDSSVAFIGQNSTATHLKPTSPLI